MKSDKVNFSPDQAAAYYARVVENPSCRWTAHSCANLPPSERPAVCANAAEPETIQERAWTSPIWYRRGSERAALAESP